MTLSASGLLISTLVLGIAAYRTALPSRFIGSRPIVRAYRPFISERRDSESAFLVSSAQFRGSYGCRLHPSRDCRPIGSYIMSRSERLTIRLQKDYSSATHPIGLVSDQAVWVAPLHLMDSASRGSV